MTSAHDDLDRFRDAHLDFLEGDRKDPPALHDLPEDKRAAAQSFVESIRAARGIDPYASRPPIEQLLYARARISDRTGELANALQKHLRSTVDVRAVVTPDATSAALDLASALVIQARGMHIRVVPETKSPDLEQSVSDKAQDIAKVFSAFPDTHACFTRQSTRIQ